MKTVQYERHNVLVSKQNLIAWAAGFFDGEGYVGIKQNDATHKYMDACIAQKDRRLLERFQTIIGRGTIGKPSKISGVSYLRFSNAQDVLMLFEFLAPFLGPQKYEQFEHAFAAWFAHKKEVGRLKLPKGRKG